MQSGKIPKGFTLIELLVVVAIMVIITSVTLIRQSEFDSSTLLRSLAYSISLSVREAQVYGTSVLCTQASCNTSILAPSYGIFIDSANTGTYKIFADTNIPANGFYGTVPADEAIQTFALAKGYTISEVCAIQGSTKKCSGPDDSTEEATIQSINIVFKRPNPDAIIIPIDSNGYVVLGVYSSAYIQVKSAAGTFRSVVVYNTGQVSVQSPNKAP